MRDPRRRSTGRAGRSWSGARPRVAFEVWSRKSVSVGITSCTSAPVTRRAARHPATTRSSSTSPRRRPRRCCSRPTGTLDPATVSGIAHLVASGVKGLDTVERHDHRRHRRAPLADAGRERRGQRDQQARGAAALLRAARRPDHLDARLDTRAEQGARARAGRHRRRPDDVRQDDVRQEGHADPEADEHRDAHEHGRRNGRACRHGHRPTPAAAGAGSKSNYQNSSGTTAFGVDKTVQRTVVAPGSVNQLNVALLVDSSVPKAEVRASSSRSRASPESTRSAATR